MNTLENIPKDSVRIGRDCCPECRSLQLERRKRWVHCQHCGANFPKPAKIEAPAVTIARAVEDKERAGRVYYRGLRWSMFTDASL